MKLKFFGIAIGGLFLIVGYGFYLTMGAGGLKRMVTITGIYSICKPDGYEVVCFLDADGKEGGLFCLPLANIGGKCLK